MALTLSYAVTGLKVKDEVNKEGVTLEHAVCQTYWKVTGTDGAGNTAEWSGATPFSAANVPAESFVGFADLQEETVIGWIQGVVEADPAYKEHIEQQLQRQIDQDITTEPTLPWASEDEVAAAATAAEDVTNPEA
jgi:hypothetical protein